MNYEKIDPLLSYDIKSNVSKNQIISVFIEINKDLKSEDKIVLEKMGISKSNDSNIITANLSIEQIETLSIQPWVKYISKSKSLKFY